MEALVRKNPTEDKVSKANGNVEILNDSVGDTIEEALNEVTEMVNTIEELLGEDVEEI